MNPLLCDHSGCERDAVCREMIEGSMMMVGAWCKEHAPFVEFEGVVGK